MAYNIINTSGNVALVVADGTLNDTTTLTLVGKNYAGYGQYLNSNFYRLLENSANTAAPTNPVQGQLWYDKTNNLLKFYNGTSFKTVAASTVSAIAPTGARVGDLWWDSVRGQLNVYDATFGGYVVVGPSFSGNSGITVGTITDSTSTDHVAVNVRVNGTLVSVISRDATYTPQTGIAGFSTIRPGYNLASSNTIAGIRYVGTATDADALGTVAASNYARTDIAASFSNTVSVASSLTVGTGGNLALATPSGVAQIVNNVNNANIAILANVGGTLTTVLSVDGTTGLASVRSTPTTSLGIATKGYVDTQITNLVNGAPGTLDTLNELANALGNDPNLAATISTQLSTRAPLSSPALVGTPTAPTANSGTSTTQIATTAFVQTAISGVSTSLGNISTQASNNVSITGGNINAVTISGLASDLAVADGGTGTSSLTANAVLIGQGTSAVTTVSPGTSGNVLTSNGTNWSSTAPAVPTVLFNQAVNSGTEYTVSLSGTNRPVQIFFNVGGVQGGNAYINVTFNWGIGSYTNTYNPINGGVNYVVTPAPSLVTFVTPSSSSTLYLRIDTTNLGIYGAWISVIQL